MNALVIGLGRAGKRHRLMLDTMGVQTTGVDLCETVEAEYHLPDSALAARCYSLAVICTPPASHLEGIEACLSHNIPKIVCEKPLCGIGQLRRASELAQYNITVTYNYRWHPAVAAGQVSPVAGGKWVCFSSQHRPQIPLWGLALDHLPHTVDLLRFLSGRYVKLTALDVVSERDGSVHLDAAGQVGDNPVTIFDNVAPHPTRRRSFIETPAGRITLDVTNMMFVNMWRDILRANEPPVAVYDAIATQVVIERAVGMLEAT